jgi:hypothetical protein
MPAVDSAYASWLQDDRLRRTWTNSGLPSGLNAMSVDSEVMTPFAASSPVDTEMARQAGFLNVAWPLTMRL